MEIKDLLKKDLMIMDLKANTKMEAIDEMIARLKEKNIVSDADVFKDLILKREERSSTGLGEGIAMPHAKTSVVNSPSVLFARSNKGVDYDALDGEPVHIFFMIAASEGAHDLHIETLAKLSKMLLNDDFTKGLLTCGSPDEVYALVDKYSEKPQETPKEEVKETQVTNKKRILAVTACPTGIAHTYMAEAALKEAGERLGVDIKVETNGADGIKNNLTANDINDAVGIIVAADKKVETARFNDRKVIVTSTADAIKNAETLIKKVLNNEAPIFKAEASDNTEEDSQANDSIGRIIYKSIMSGVSNMLPFVIGGGILLALSFIVERFMGQNELFKLLYGVGGGAFHFLIPVLAGFIAMSIADKPGFMPGAVAGYMASQGAGFLGGLIGGFIAGYSVIFLKKMTKNMSKQFDGMKSMVIYPIFSLAITGILMYFILLMGIVGLYAILERFFYFASKERNNYSKLPSEVKQLIKEGKIKESIIYLNSNKSSTSTVLKEILIYGYKENKETLSALEEKGKEKAIEQIKHLERNMWLLSLAANASPLLGLLGTVTGMITAFNSIALNGTGDAGILAKGISEALYTTAGGLFVAIPCMIFYNYFNKRIDLVVADIEKTCTELLNYFRE